MDYLAECTSTNITKKLDELEDIKVGDCFVFDRDSEWFNSYMDENTDKKYHEEFIMKYISKKVDEYMFEVLVTKNENYCISIFNFLLIWYRDINKYSIYQGYSVENFAIDKYLGIENKYYGNYFINILFNDVPSFNQKYKNELVSIAASKVVEPITVCGHEFNVEIMPDNVNEVYEKEQILEQIPEQTSEQIPEQTSEQIPEQTSEQIPEQTSEQIPEQTSEQIPEQTSEQIPEQTSEQIPEQTSEQIPEQTSEQIPEQTSEQIPEQTSEQIPEQTSEQISEQNSIQLLDQTEALLEFEDKLSALKKLTDIENPRDKDSMKKVNNLIKIINN